MLQNELWLPQRNSIPSSRSMSARFDLELADESTKYALVIHYLDMIL